MQRPLLSDSAYSEQTATQVANFHRDVVDEVAKAVKHDKVVVVGMAQNPFVKKARNALSAAEVQFTYLEYGSYLSQWKPRLAIKMWSGWSTFPQVFVRGTLLGGFTDLEKALADGTLKAQLEEG